MIVWQQDGKSDADEEEEEVEVNKKDDDDQVCGIACERGAPSHALLCLTTYYIACVCVCSYSMRERAYSHALLGLTIYYIACVCVCVCVSNMACGATKEQLRWRKSRSLHR